MYCPVTAIEKRAGEQPNALNARPRADPIPESLNSDR